MKTEKMENKRGEPWHNESGSPSPCDNTNNRKRNQVKAAILITMDGRGRWKRISYTFPSFFFFDAHITNIHCVHI